MHIWGYGGTSFLDISLGSDQFYVQMTRSENDMSIAYKHPEDADYTAAVAYTLQGTVGSTNWVNLTGSTHSSENSYADYDYKMYQWFLNQ